MPLDRDRPDGGPTVHPDPATTPLDGGGGDRASAGEGDTTHPEDWAGERSVEKLREIVTAQGLDPGDRSAAELVELLKKEKPANRTDPVGRSGPDAHG